MRIGKKRNAHKGIGIAVAWLLVSLASASSAHGAWFRLKITGTKHAVLIDPSGRKSGNWDTTGVVMTAAKHWEGDLSPEGRSETQPVAHFQVDSPMEGMYLLSAEAVGGLVQVDYVGANGQQTVYMVDVDRATVGEPYSWTLGWKLDRIGKPPLIRMYRELAQRQGDDLTPGGRRGRRVQVVVDGGVSAMLLDERGRRTGWDAGLIRRDIVGCRYAATGVGPEPARSNEARHGAGGAFTGAAVPPPDVSEFEFDEGRELGGVFADGSCELQLTTTSVLFTSVGLSLMRSLGGSSHVARSDTLRAGVQYRCQLQWSASPESCRVSIVGWSEAPIRQNH